MAKINLSLIVGGSEVLSAEGGIDNEGRIFYARKKGAVEPSNGRLNLNDVYMQLINTANKRGYKTKPFEIRITIGKD